MNAHNAHIRLVDLLDDSARSFPHHIAYSDAQNRISYIELQRAVRLAATELRDRGVTRGDRVATFAPKQYEHIVLLLAANAIGAIFVPVNPQLKEHQVLHIVNDSGACLLFTTEQRLGRLPSIKSNQQIKTWFASELHQLVASDATPMQEYIVRVVDNDPAAILYTSGSTGKPKGVVLSQRNLVSGAESVACYQELSSDDVILGVLPISFDAGLSQLTTALAVGACYTPLDFMQPTEVPRYCEAQKVTSITAVPPLWMQIASVAWPAETGARICRIANTGGHMPGSLLQRLQTIFPAARPYLMYGLTEAFRSTYLHPDDVAHRPNSIGKAVPNAEILVLRPDGSQCDFNEPGELVHRGAFVTLGYWNRPDLTAERFRPLPHAHSQIPSSDSAVWSGDIVQRDAEGFLYFVARGDDMIKTSGYRVSPTEVEEILFEIADILEAAVFSVPHPTLGQGIMAAVQTNLAEEICREAILRACKEKLPTYMVPVKIAIGTDPLPRNPNGKIDRALLKQLHEHTFAADTVVAESVGS